MIYDVVIIGSGPAGISASLYTARANLKTIIISKKEGALIKAGEIENYYGFSKPIDSLELLDNGYKQASNLGVEIIEDEVVNIGFDGNYVITGKKNTISAKSVVIATGTNRAAPNIKGLVELEGKGVGYCAVCDGFFYKQKDVAVLGFADYALHEANELVNIVNKVTILTNGQEPKTKFPDTMTIITKKVKQIVGTEHVNKVIFDDDSEINVEAVFVAYGIAGSVDLAKKIGAEVANNKIVVDDNMMTNLPGLYAVGDCVGGMLQIAKAVYEGAKASTSIIKYIRTLNQK